MGRAICRADITVYVVGTGQRVELFPGVEVELDRELSPGHTLRHAIAGREDCFESVVDHAPSSAHADEDDAA